MTDQQGPYFNSSGRPQVPDHSGRTPTRWQARASALVSMSRATLERIAGETGDRGDVLSVASVGGVLGANKLSELIPVCHRKTITAAEVEFELNMTLSAINVVVTVKGIATAGVDSEAMAGAAAAALTIYELCKDIDSSLRIEQVRLEESLGGDAAERDLVAQMPPPEAVLRPRLTVLTPGDRLITARKIKVKRKVKAKSPAKKKPRKKAAPKTKSKSKPKSKLKPKLVKAKLKRKPMKPKLKLSKPKAIKPKLKTKRKSPARPKTKAKTKAKGRPKRS